MAITTSCPWCGYESEGIQICDKCNGEFGDLRQTDANGYNCTCQHCGNNVYYIECPNCGHWLKEDE